MSSERSGGGGIGFFGLLGIVFITLKLTGYIDWSWWWVTAPLWGPIAILIVVVVFGALVYAMYLIAKELDARKKRRESKQQ